MFDLGILITGAAAGLAFVPGRGKWLRHLLVISWAATAIAAGSGVSMAGVVFIMAMCDLVIAGAAVTIATNDPNRIDARFVGGLSMALMPLHWVMAWSQGSASWLLYASACNAAFVIQCLTVGGWLDGVGRSLGRFFHRFRPVRSLRDGRR